MLRKYKVDSVNGEGWALILLDLETGFFATASDHGNYVHVWSHPGKEFRAFLLGIRPDYLFDKLMMERPDKRVYDPEATRASIREAIDKVEDPEDKAFEVKLLTGEDPESGLSFDLDEEAGFDDWMEFTRLEEAGRHFIQVPEVQCTQFCNVIFPRFQKLLKAELEAEKKDHELAEAIRENRPVIMGALMQELVSHPAISAAVAPMIRADLEAPPHPLSTRELLLPKEKKKC